MNAQHSYLYRGTIAHTRLKPFRHGFRYRVYYTLLDIDELATLDLRLFSVGGFSLYSFHPSGHGVRTPGEIRPWVEGILADAGIHLDGGSIKLLAFPRVLGYVFNPLSVWYCYDIDSELRAVLYEVRNTFGDRHVYAVPIRDNNDLRHSFAKRLHVSPFNDMDQTYQFSITDPAAYLSIGIEQRDAEGTMFRAGLRLERLPLTDLNLLRVFVTHPLVTGKVILGIHWQALRLWLKGARYHRRPEPTAPTVTIETSVSS
ncbi:MAG: DUF1365 domain-containing protein [Acidimicrobiia bacterium]